MAPTTFAHVSFHSMAGGQGAAVHVAELFEALRRRELDGIAINRSSASRLRWLAYVSVLVRALRRVRHVDFLYVRAHPVSLPLLVVARCVDTTTVVEVNGTSADMRDTYPGTRPISSLMDLADRAVLRVADGAVAVSAGLSQWASAHAPDTPVVVIPNAADSRRFRPDVPPREGLPERYVAYCGAMARWQGLETLAEASTHARWPAGVRLVVAGDGPLRPALADAAAKGAPIVDVGVLPHHQIPEVLVGALAVVSPRAHRHASPMKVYEALACGTPVIASAVPGQVELLESRECGLTFPPGDAANLAAAVAAVANDPALRARLSAAARAVGQENTWDARAAAVLEFVDAVASDS